MQDIFVDRFNSKETIASAETQWIEKLLIVFSWFETCEGTMLIALLVYLDELSKICEILEQRLYEGTEIKDKRGTCVPNGFLNQIHDFSSFRPSLSKVLLSKGFEIRDQILQLGAVNFQSVVSRDRKFVYCGLTLDYDEAHQ